MLDLFGIVVSSVVMFLVIVRAIRMDAMTPWFRPPRTGADSSGLRLARQEPGDARSPMRREERRRA
jgi:hypothetical protein